MQTKQCFRCRLILPVSSFGPMRANRDGRDGRCRDCTAQATREYRRANPEYRKKEIERRAARRAAGLRFPSEVLSPRHVPTAEEKVLSKERACFRSRIKAARDKADRQGATVNDFTVEDWYAILEERGRHCAYCGASDSLWIDHVVPIARGGDNTKSNVVPSCESCNRRKSKRSAEQFMNNLCHRNHPLEGDNLYVYPDGVAFACIACRQMSVDKTRPRKGKAA